jgi:hypothetical protein
VFFGAQNTISAIGDFKGDTSLQDAFLTDVAFMIKLLEGKEAELVQLWIEMSQFDEEEWETIQ